jgi:hypothetical protein
LASELITYIEREGLRNRSKLVLLLGSSKN